jgi:hypothetical protein
MIPFAKSIHYMTIGYGAILTMLALYLVSLVGRWQKLKRDLRTLEELKKDDQSSSNHFK